MRISDLIKMGLRNLSRRKARTALTVVGVVIGTISIVVMISIGIGINNNYDAMVMQSSGFTTIEINTYADVYDDDGNWVDMKEQVLDDAMIEQIKQIDHVNAVTPFIYVDAQMTLKNGKYQGWGNFYAVDMDQLQYFSFPGLTEGEMPSDEHPDTFIFGCSSINEFYDTNNYRDTKTPVLGQEKITFQFSPYNYQLKDENKQFTYDIKSYGVMEQSDNYFDYYIFMDLDFYKEIYKKYCNTLKLEDRKKAMAAMNTYQTVRVSVDSVNNVTEVQDEIEQLGFQTYSDMMYMEPLKETANMLEMVLGGIGGIAMLVSAISIANTMIMSIYERTKEIGVMKVLGCVIKDIKKLFLFESAMIGGIGGAIGVGISYLVSWLINKYGAPIFQSIMQTSYMYDSTTTTFSSIPFWLPVLAVAFAMFIGILSGYYPARRATRISAIEAMKTEG